MILNTPLNTSLSRLYNYCYQEKFKGWDNFDGLNSVWFNNSPFSKSAFVRLAWTQFCKRSPINLRRLVFVPKGYNAKGLALFISGLVCMGKQDEAAALIGRLKEMRCSGYSGSSWGYNFDWQSRYFLTRVGTPNIVTTVFVANALLDYHDSTANQECLELAIDGCRFFLEDLILHEDDKAIFFGYMPKAQTRVHNANMMAAALLARVYHLTGDKDLLGKSRKAMAYSVKALRSDYSWPYGEHPGQKFIDNFHTGFNLVALADWMKYSGDERWKEELKKAFGYFAKTFWREDGCPKYYHNSLYPIDIHCSAQGIVTFLKLHSCHKQAVPMAQRIARWAIDNMQDESGYFYYQKTKWYTNKIPYIRWSQAWMFYALSFLQTQVKQ